MESSPTVSRRDILKLGTTAAVTGAIGAAGGGLGPRDAAAQTPKRGGIFHIRHHVQPVHFDPQQTIAFSTQWPLSYCMSRLVKVKAGPAVVPGTQPIEGDLAESWTQPNDTTYVFKLRKGVRWHPKPPVNGRELTAEDVKYTYERFLTVKGNPNRPVLEQVDKVEVARSTHGAVRPQGAVRLVPRRPRLDVDLDHRQGGGGEVRRSEEARGRRRHRAVDARALRAGHAHHLCEEPELLRPRAALCRRRRGVHRHRSLRRVRQLHHRPLRLRAGVRPGRAPQRPRGRAAEDPAPADQGLHRGVRRHHLDEARSGAVQGRARAARARHGQQLARGARDQCLVAGQGCPQPRDPRRAQGVVDPDRPAPSGGPPALRARHRGGEAPPRRGRLAERLQDAVRDDGRLWPGLHGRRPDRAQELEGGRRRDGSQAQGVRRLHLEHALRQVRQDGGRALRRQQ